MIQAGLPADAASCLSDETIARLVEGRLPLAALSAAQEHVATCRLCLDLLTSAAQALPMEPTLPGTAAPMLLGDRGAAAEERFALRKLHAEGGIGRVWLAWDEALGREVALKELRPKWDGAAEISARFVSEARITGQLEHPGIVPIYELSRHAENGQPYYAMRFIHGRTLAEAIAAHHPTRSPSSLRDLLGAFVSVCNAVAYAHSRGVLHRDLKGQNVALGDFGEVIVLDWGLAKVKAAPGEAPPLSLSTDAGPGETEHGQVLGTPGYMAPEQAQGRTDLVDARSDLYSLGAILYEILTGAPPHRGADTKEVLRQTIQDEPMRPRLVVPGTPRALEAVCQKCLAKRREDRYDSVKDLADEIGRYLAGEPVRAYREPPLVRLQRFSRRHRTLMAGIAALLLTATVALSVSAVLLRRANRRTLAQRDEARRAVDTFLTQVSEEQLLHEQGLRPLRERLLRSALTFYESFAKKHGSDPGLHRDLANANRHVGEILSDLGKRDDARAALRQALYLYGPLEGVEPGGKEARSGRAKSYLTMAYAQLQDGRPSEARSAAKEAADRFERLRAEEPQQAVYGRLLGRSYDLWAGALRDEGQSAAALQIYERALSVLSQTVREAPEDLDAKATLAELHRSFAKVYLRMADPRAQERSLLLAIAIEEPLLVAAPGRSMFRAGLAASLSSMGKLHFDLGRPSRAEPFQERACTLAERIVQDNPGVPVFARALSDSVLRRGRIKAALGHTAQAGLLLKKAVALEEQIGRSHGGRGSLDYLSWRYQVVGLLARDLGDLVTAKKEQERALLLRLRLMADGPKDPVHRSELLWGQERLGLILVDAGQKNAAAQIPEQQRIIREREVLVKVEESAEKGGNAGVRMEVAQGYVRLSDLQRRAGARTDALAAIAKALSTLDALVRGQPENLSFQREQADVLAARGALLAELGQMLPAQEAARQAVTLSEKLAKEDPAYLFALGANRALLSAVVEAAERAELAAAAVQALRQVVEAGYDNGHKLRSDARLAPLQGRADFQAILRSLPER